MSTVTDRACRTPADGQSIDPLIDALLRDHPPDSTPAAEFLGAQFDLGLAFVHFPPGCGGLGLPAALQRVVDEQLDQAGAPSAFTRNFIGVGMCAPTVAAWGTSEQRSRHLRPCFTGDDIWCQLFSEPGAGSDVAGLGTRAVADGDEWIVNGQKVWTTVAHAARWGLLIARTDPDVTKHAGLSAFIVDMSLPGIDVRPLRQMTGEAEFNEVYLTDVRLAAAARLGPVGEGWRVALTTLMNERTSIGGAAATGMLSPIAELLDAWSTTSPGDRTPVRRDRVARLWARSEVLRLTALRAQRGRTTGDPGPEGSIVKLATAELNKDIYDALTTVMGASATLFGSYDDTEPDAEAFGVRQRAFLRSRANSIEGGTTEVLKNIIGERVLGLAGDVRVDRDVPWRQLRCS